jgi:HK97 family phage prohead protease
MNTLYAFCERRGTRAADKPGSPIRFIASTEDVARDGLIIESTAWDLAAYKRNPVILWGHDLMGSRPPIGKAVDIAVRERRLIADIVFDQDDPFARDVERKYRTGFLNAVSVSWDTRKIAPGTPPRVTKAELLEISAVPVPSDAGALVAGRGLRQRSQATYDPVLAELDRLRDQDERERAIREYARWYRLRVLGGLPVVGRRY